MNFKKVAFSELQRIKKQMDRGVTTREEYVNKTIHVLTQYYSDTGADGEEFMKKLNSVVVKMDEAVFTLKNEILNATRNYEISMAQCSANTSNIVLFVI